MRLSFSPRQQATVVAHTGAAAKGSQSARERSGLTPLSAAAACQRATVVAQMGAETKAPSLHVINYLAA